MDHYYGEHDASSEQLGGETVRGQAPLEDRPPSALPNVELLGRIMQDLNYMIDVRGNTQLIPALVLVKGNRDEFEALRRMARAMEDADADEAEDGDEEPHFCYMGHPDCWDPHTNERLADEADWEEDRGRLS